MIEISLNNVKLYIQENGDYVLKTKTKDVTLREIKHGDEKQ